MSEHKRDTEFLRRVILYDESNDCRKLEKCIADVQNDERCVQRVASVTALFPLLALAGAAYGVILQDDFPHDGSELVFRLLCELGLASLICLVAFAGLLVVYRLRLNRLREEGRQRVTSLLESRLGKPPIASSPGTLRVSGDGALASAVEARGLMIDGAETFNPPCQNECTATGVSAT